MIDPFQEFNWLADDGIFLPMINDKKRNRFYFDAIKSTVPGKVVVDIGTGTGILSIISARSGADRVFAVEQDPARAEFARQMFQSLHLSDIVEVINDDFLNIDIKADVYVTETINVQIFGENILNISDHALKHGGVFIPGQFEITAQIFKDHPIFTLDQNDYEVFECDTGIDIDSGYKNQIDQDFSKRHDLHHFKYRGNHLNNLFQLLPRIPEIKLDTIYTTKPLIVDLNQSIEVDKIRLTIPKDAIADIDSPFFIVLFWKARHQNIVMDCRDVYFGNVCKYIQSEYRNSDTDVEIWWHPESKNWYFDF